MEQIPPMNSDRTGEDKCLQSTCVKQTVLEFKQVLTGKQAVASSLKGTSIILMVILKAKKDLPQASNRTLLLIKYRLNIFIEKP